MFRAFQVLSNELNYPNILICPSDTRTPASNFVTLLSNTNVSYFVSLDAKDSYPQMVLSGDRNLEIDGVAAKPGIVALQSNNVISWTTEMHKRRGNIAFADGSVQVITKFNLRSQDNGVATNRLAMP
jgi:prepilin-type processing-associated H-X9-DG protein